MSGSAHGAPPPNSPTMTSFPPFGSTSKPSGARDLGERLRVAAVDGCERAGVERRAALALVDIDEDRALAAERLEDGDAHQAEPAGADHDDRLGCDHVVELPQRAVGRHAGA